MNKWILFFVLCLISFFVTGQDTEKSIFKDNDHSLAMDYFIISSQKAEQGDYIGAVTNLSEVIRIDTGYVTAYLHYLQKPFYESTETYLSEEVIVRLTHRKAEISHLKKDTRKLLNSYRDAQKTYKKAEKADATDQELKQLNNKTLAIYDNYKASSKRLSYLNRDIVIDASSPGLMFLNGLFMVQWFFGKNFLQPNIDLRIKGKTFREALLNDNDYLKRQLKSEIEQLDINKKEE